VLDNTSPDEPPEAPPTPEGVQAVDEGSGWRHSPSTHSRLRWSCLWRSAPGRPTSWRGCRTQSTTPTPSAHGAPVVRMLRFPSWDAPRQYRAQFAALVEQLDLPHDDDEDGYHTGNVVPLTRSARQPLRKGRLDESA